MDLTLGLRYSPARQGSTSQRRHKRSQIYTEEQWEKLRPDITKLHKTNTATGVRCILEDNHNFFVKYKLFSSAMMETLLSSWLLTPSSEKMLKGRFKKWNLRKYCPKAKRKSTNDRNRGLESLRIGETLTSSPQSPPEVEEADQGLKHLDYSLTQRKWPSILYQPLCRDGV
jgi:hypothetical protein